MTIELIPRKVERYLGKGKFAVDDVLDIQTDGWRYRGTAIIEPEDKGKHGNAGAVRLRMMGSDSEIFCIGAKADDMLELAKRYL